LPKVLFDIFVNSKIDEDTAEVSEKVILAKNIRIESHQNPIKVSNSNTGADIKLTIKSDELTNCYLSELGIQ